MAKQKTKANYTVTTETYKDAILYHIIDSNTHTYLDENLKLVSYIDEHTLTCKSEDEAGLIARILNKNSLASTVRMIQDIYARQAKPEGNNAAIKDIYSCILSHFKENIR